MTSSISFNSLSVALSIAFFALATKLPSSNADLGTLIVGGENATKNEFPWLVHFEVSITEEESRFCTGALLNLNHVLTAASCFIDHDESVPIKVIAGDYLLEEDDGSEQERDGVEVIIHPGFNSLGNLDKDIAILRLSASFGQTDAVAPIGLPSVAVDPELYGTGIAAGWGEFNISYGATEQGPFSSVLQKAEVAIQNPFVCRTLPVELPTDQFCTYGNKGAYRGDIGGPLVCEDEELKSIVCGILSNTMKINVTSVVNGYVEVSYYLDWIEENTGVTQPTTVPSTTRATIPTTTTPTTTSTTTIPTTPRSTTTSEAVTNSNPTSETIPESSSSSSSDGTGSTVSLPTTLESDGTSSTVVVTPSTSTIIPSTTTPPGGDLSTTPADASATSNLPACLSIIICSILVTAL